MMTIEFQGVVYRVKPNAPDAPDQSNRMAFLLWLNRWTFKRGYQREAMKLPNMTVITR